MSRDAWTRRGWIAYISSAMDMLRYSRAGMRWIVAKKLLFDFFIARNSVLLSILRDMIGLKTHTTERVIELPMVEQIVSMEDENALCVEVGCGDSNLMLRLAKKRRGVIGVDVNPYPFSHDYTEFVAADATSLPFRDDSVDLVYSLSTIEHIGVGYYGDKQVVEGDKKAVTEFGRIVKSKGKLLITVPFGCKGIPGFERVYDSRSISKLLGKYDIIRQSYWVFRDEYWGEIPSNDASVGPPLRQSETLPSGVIIVVARKA